MTLLKLIERTNRGSVDQVTCRVLAMTKDEQNLLIFSRELSFIESGGYSARFEVSKRL
jgi:hypothetical protein